MACSNWARVGGGCPVDIVDGVFWGEGAISLQEGVGNRTRVGVDGGFVGSGSG